MASFSFDKTNLKLDSKQISFEIFKIFRVLLTNFYQIRMKWDHMHCETEESTFLEIFMFLVIRDPLRVD